jgi:hypothetical protein
LLYADPHSARAAHNLHTLFMVLHFCQSIYPSLYSNHQNS